MHSRFQSSLNRLCYVQACLGAKAKPGERNVVELTAEDENGEEVTHAILSLSVGGTEQVKIKASVCMEEATHPKPLVSHTVGLPEVANSISGGSLVFMHNYRAARVQPQVHS